MVQVRKFIPLLLIIMVLVLCGCPSVLSMGDAVKLYKDMTPQEKVTYFMDVYNTQYEDYLIVSSQEGLTEDEKVLLRKEKKILIQLYDAINVYDAAIILAEGPSQDQEKVVLKFINDLLYPTEGGD